MPWLNASRGTSLKGLAEASLRPCLMLLEPTPLNSLAVTPVAFSSTLAPPRKIVGTSFPISLAGSCATETAPPPTQAIPCVAIDGIAPYKARSLAF